MLDDMTELEVIRKDAIRLATVVVNLSKKYQEQLVTSARRSRSISSVRFRKSISASTLISDRFTFAIVISGEKTE